MAVRRYTFKGTLNLEGALHVGSGRGSTPGIHEWETDATVVRTSRGQFYIPGSSLRGVLRSAIGQLGTPLLSSDIAMLRDESVLRTEVEQPAVAAVTEKRNQAQKHKRQSFDAERALQEELQAPGRLTPAERLFGTTLWASPLLIPDLHLCAHQNERVPSEVRHGVGINRDTGAAHDGAKYDFEVLPQGTRFTLQMRCDIPTEYEVAWTRLLALALRLLEQGELILGGRAARGGGQVKLVNLQVYILDMSNVDALLHALLAADEQAEECTNPEKHIPERYGTPHEGTWTIDILRTLHQENGKGAS